MASPSRCRILARRARIRLRKLGKDTLQRACLDADPRVGHGDDQVLSLAPRGQTDAALMGELGGIAQKVQHDLPETLS